jgi:RNA polymerase-binding transcription factor DksA
MVNLHPTEISVFEEILKRAKDQIAAHGKEEAISRVAAEIVEADVAKKASALSQGIAQKQKLQSERKKIEKPDQVVYGLPGPDGKAVVVSEGYSKDRLDAIAKIDQGLNKINKAFEKAEGGDYSDLANLPKDKS